MCTKVGARSSPIFNLSKKLNINHINEAGRHFKFHIVIPFMSVEGAKFITDECKYLNTQCNLYKDYDMLSLKNLVDLPKYYPENIEEILRDKFEISLKLDLPLVDMPAIYFDHKVAAPESTFSSIYLQGKIPNSTKSLSARECARAGAYFKYFGSLFKIDPNREKIIELSMLYEKYINSKTIH